MNGKSGNMNNVLAQIYPTGCFIPGDEIIAVFDADQVRCHTPHTCASRQAHQWPRPAAVHGPLCNACMPPACAATTGAACMARIQATSMESPARPNWTLLSC